MDAVAINGALCKALGLNPEHVKAVTIKLTAADAPKVEVEYSRRYLFEHPELADAIATFELVPIDAPNMTGWAEG